MALRLSGLQIAAVGRIRRSRHPALKGTIDDYQQIGDKKR
ncbi:hypothetical protein HMPREF3220_00724 [Citrobacter koseri]|nr:hypothetical protein HMPREF3207_02247 [Citrobacter koseri]KXA03352.1 hypothetical protein HMPREF3220_00724 [Citrobacter koseri]